MVGPYPGSPDCARMVHWKFAGLPGGGVMPDPVPPRPPPAFAAPPMASQLTVGDPLFATPSSGPSSYTGVFGIVGAVAPAFALIVPFCRFTVPLLPEP